MSGADHSLELPAPLLNVCTPQVDALPSIQQLRQTESSRYLKSRRYQQNALSQFATGFGYLASMVILGLSLILVFEKVDLYFQIIVCGVGVCWLVLGLAAISALQERPIEAAIETDNCMKYAFSSMLAACRDMCTFKQLFMFLGIFLFYQGPAFAVRDVILRKAKMYCWPEQFLMFLGLVIWAASTAGTWGFYHLQARVIHVKNKAMIIGHVLACAVVCLWAIFGNLGEDNEVELYLICILYGVNRGSMQSYSRSLFAGFVPEDRECAFFSLYTAAAAASDIIGALFTMMIAVQTGSLTNGLIYIFCLLVTAAVVFMAVIRPNVGVEQAGRGV